MDLFKKDYIVGLDIGTTSVKIAQFVKREDGLHLVKADLKEIKDEKEIVHVLKDLFKGIDLKKSKIIANINCPKTSLKIVKAPYMPKTELRDGIILEAKNYFPFPIDDSILDYEILGDVVEKGVRKYEVAVSISPKMTVNRYMSLLEKAGIKTVSFVPCPYALQKLTEHTYPSVGKDETTCLVDIGKHYTELVILKGKALMFSRKIPVTGEDFTKALMGVLVSDRGKTELTLDEAEKIKKDIGIPAGEESKIIDDKISTIQILSMLRTPLEHIINEIERCFDYYREETGSGRVDSLVLFGGSAALTGLTKFLSDGLGVEVKLGDALEGLKVETGAINEKGKISYRLELAIGAALTEGKGINLLPIEIKEKTKRVITRGTVEVIATAVILISALFYIGMKIQVSNFDKKISVAKLELASLDPQLKKAEAHHLAGQVLIDEPHWMDIFKELGNLIHEDIHFTNMNMGNNVITIKGISSSEYGEEVLSNFILTLEKGIFKDVKLVKVEDLPDKVGNKFELKCHVD